MLLFASPLKNHEMTQKNISFRTVSPACGIALTLAKWIKSIIFIRLEIGISEGNEELLSGAASTKKKNNVPETFPFPLW
jgi:hypothetical protein